MTAEYELTTINSVEIDLPKDDENSGIYAAESERVIIDGRVHMESCLLTFRLEQQYLTFPGRCRVRCESLGLVDF